MTDWPAPEVAHLEVGVDDPHVPNAARLAYRKAVKAGWSAKLTYARGTSMVGKDCAPGPIMESVVLRLSRLSAPSLAVATWEARARALCEPCGKSLLPSAKGLFIAHKVAGRDSEPCPGSGQPAIGDAGAREYAFTCAYVTRGPGWWTTQVPEKVDAKRFAAILVE